MRHDVCRNLVPVRIDQAEAGSLDDHVAAAELLATFGRRPGSVVVDYGIERRLDARQKLSN